MTTAVTTKHIDELQDFHLRDMSRLKPGVEIFFGHTPAVDFEEQGVFYWDLHPLRVWGTFAKVVEILETPEGPRISYSYEGGESPSERYASDAGVLPYSGTYYNNTNFTVILSDLREQGIEIDLEPSPSYRAALEDYNSSISREPVW